MADGSEVERRAPFGDNPVVGARGARTQRRILSAALEVFAEHGYHDSNVEQITHAAGCSRPTFYQYFSSKEDVFRALARSVGRDVVALIERLGPVPADAGGRAALAEWLEAFSHFYDRHAPVFTAFSAAVRTDAGLAGGSAVVNVAFGRTLRRQLDLRGGPGVDADVLASTVVTMIVRANLLRYGTPGVVGRRRFVDGLAELVHRVVADLPAAAGGDERRPPRPRLRRRTVPLRATDGHGNGASDAPPLSPQGRQMRDRLVAAGTAVFPRLGFHDTRIDDVVAEAGVSHGSFYRYFENKEDLFRVIATDAANQLITRLHDLPVDGGPEALRRWLGEWFGVYARHGAIISLWREMEFSDPVVEDVTRKVADAALNGVVAVLEREGVGDPVVNAMALVGLLETIPHHVHAFGYFSEDDAIAALVAVIERGLLGRLPGG